MAQVRHTSLDLSRVNEWYSDGHHVVGIAFVRSLMPATAETPRSALPQKLLGHLLEAVSKPVSRSGCLGSSAASPGTFLQRPRQVSWVDYEAVERSSGCGPRFLCSPRKSGCGAAGRFVMLS